jgi:predicted P-loop ATPase
MHTREASSYVRGRWIIELAELANVSKAEVEIVKAFISRTEERFRPAYGRNEVSYPRQCVFMGSTNRTDYLRDDTGNRRFWPVQVGRVDVKALQADRDQLWGEAVALYRAGETWWLSAAVERIAAQEQGDRMLEDPWTSNVLNCVEGKDEVCVSQVLGDMMIEVGRKDRMMSNRVQSILMQNGWFRSGRMTSGTYKAQNRFIRKRDAEQQAKQQQAAEVKAAAGVASGLGDMEADVF